MGRLQNLKKSLTLFWNYLLKSKQSGGLFQIFVACSEYLNLIISNHVRAGRMGIEALEYIHRACYKCCKLVWQHWKTRVKFVTAMNTFRYNLITLREGRKRGSHNRVAMRTLGEDKDIRLTCKHSKVPKPQSRQTFYPGGPRLI